MNPLFVAFKVLLRLNRVLPVPLVTDGKGEIIRKLNAYFLPRAYGFDLEGKLIWKQNNLMVTQLDAIRSVVEVVRGKDYAKQVFEQKPEWAKTRKADRN